MTEQTATFQVNMEGNLRTSSTESADALERLRSKIDGDVKALRQMESALRNLKKGQGQNIDQYLALKKQIGETSERLSKNQASFIALGGSFEKGARRGRRELGLLGTIAQKLPGPLGNVAQKLQTLSEDKSAMRMMLVRAALVAVVVAAVAAAGALLKLGIAHSDARRSEGIHLEGLTKIRDWYGRAADSGAFLQASIDKVSASSALGRAQISGYTEQLYRMGLRGANLQAALEGVATVASVQGDAQAQMFAQMAAGAAASGQGVRRLADDVKSRLGGLAAAKMLSLSVQSEKLKENLAGMLSGLKLDKFLSGLNQVTQLFSQNTASGRALKALFTGMFQPIVDGLAGAGPIAKRFFQGLTIGALLIGIAFLRVRNAIRDAIGGPKILSDATKLEMALYAGEAAALALGTAVTFVLGKALVAGAGFLWGLASAAWAAVAPLGALAVKAVIAAAPFLLMAGALVLALAAGMALGYGLIKLGEWIASFDWGGIARSVIDGLVGGLRKGFEFVKKTMKDLGNATVTAFKDALGIRSPARKMRPQGLDTARGTAVGIRAGIPEVERAARDMGDAIPGAVESPGRLNLDPIQVPTGGASKSSSVSISIGELIVQTAAQSTKEIATDIRAELMRMLEDVALELGEKVAT